MDTLVRDAYLPGAYVPKMCSPTIKRDLDPNDPTKIISSRIILTCDTIDADIYYTTDGSRVTRETAYLYSVFNYPRVQSQCSITVRAIAVCKNSAAEDSDETKDILDPATPDAIHVDEASKDRKQSFKIKDFLKLEKSYEFYDDVNYKNEAIDEDLEDFDEPPSALEENKAFVSLNEGTQGSRVYRKATFSTELGPTDEIAETAFPDDLGDTFGTLQESSTTDHQARPVSGFRGSVRAQSFSSVQSEAFDDPMAVTTIGQQYNDVIEVVAGRSTDPTGIKYANKQTNNQPHAYAQDPDAESDDEEFDAIEGNDAEGNQEFDVVDGVLNARLDDVSAPGTGGDYDNDNNDASAVSSHYDDASAPGTGADYDNNDASPVNSHYDDASAPGTGADYDNSDASAVNSLYDDASTPVYNEVDYANSEENSLDC